MQGVFTKHGVSSLKKRDMFDDFFTPNKSGQLISTFSMASKINFGIGGLFGKHGYKSKESE